MGEAKRRKAAAPGGDSSSDGGDEDRPLPAFRMKADQGEPVVVVNSGSAIKETNFWDVELAKRGILFVSWNASAARVLLPDNQNHLVAEMATAKYVVVSRGPWKSEHVDNCTEFLFEDETDTPFDLIVGPHQTDRFLPPTDQGGGFVVTVWTRDGMVLSRPGKYRVVDEVPCLEPWVEQ